MTIHFMCRATQNVSNERKHVITFSTLKPNRYGNKCCINKIIKIVRHTITACLNGMIFHISYSHTHTHTQMHRGP
jgi:hypothetical protein